MESKQEHIELIIKYFTGEIAPDELSMLSALLKSDVVLQNEFDEQNKIWNSVEKFAINNVININTEWEKLQLQISKQETKVISIGSRVEKKNTFGAFKIAATIALIAVTSFVIYYFTNKEDSNKIQLASTTIVLESKLPDGTVVSLNANSQIEYPEHFAENKRAVKLTGQAFFNVIHDKSRPFIIDAGNVFVEVVGTSFFVNTNAEGKTLVVVSTGKVTVYKKDNVNEKVYLEPGEKAEFIKTHGNITKSPNNDANFIAWKTHKFVFNDEPLGEIVTQLNSVYQANIRIEGNAISDCRITAAFDNQSLDAVLKVLEATVNLKITRSGNKFVITGSECR